MYRKFSLILIIVLLLIINSMITRCGGLGIAMPIIQGPYVYLTRILDAMRNFHNDHGFYPSDLNTLNPYINVYDGIEGEDFEYKIMYADENSFIVISQNNRSLQNYQITENSIRPVWLFKDKKEREQKLKELIDIIDKYKKDSIALSAEQHVFWGSLYRLSNFSYDEVGDYFFNLIQKTDSRGILQCAATSLSHTVHNPTKVIIDKFAEIEKKKLCEIILLPDQDIINMLLRSNERGAIETSIHLLEWVIVNCKPDLMSPLHRQCKKAISELKAKLSLLK